MLKRLLSDSVSLVFGNLEAVFKVCGSWFVLQFVLMTIIQLSIGDSGRLEANPGAAVLLSLVVMIFSLVSSASISVAWHRFGLIGEQPGLIHLKFSGVEFSFVLKSLLLGLLMIGAWLVVMLIHFTIGAPAITGVFALLVMAFAIPTFFRFSLILPATAVERPIGLGQAYAISEGLGWRMFLATIILALPFVLGGCSSATCCRKSPEDCRCC